jgi:hypothetical protein
MHRVDVTAHIEFCGEVFSVTAGRPVVLGRDGDITIDDNPFLHRRFLEVSEVGSLVWLRNVGTQLSATVSDAGGRVQAWLAPGARLPLVFDRTVVWFTAGPTTYEFEVIVEQAPYEPAGQDNPGEGDTTVGRVSFTPDQKLLIVALSENILRHGRRMGATIPNSAEAAARLGWTLTRFNRKLDNVCEKLTRAGIRGLHGGPEKLATNRRARLVEYSLAARFVTADDIVLLDSLQA